jgi:hypothetical protein
MNENKQEIACSLDEINAAYSLMTCTKNDAIIAKCRTWIKIQKITLKHLGYKGKIPRFKRETS